MQIRDTITFQSRPPFPDLAVSEPEQARESFVITREAGALCSLILGRLALCPNPQPGGLVLTGNRGVGKTHLLQFLAALVRHPNSPSWTELAPFIRNGALPTVPLNSLFIEVPEDPEVRLEHFLSERFGDLLSSSRKDVPAGLASRLRKATIQLSENALGFIVLDDLSRRIDRITDPQQLQRDTRLYRTLAEAFSQRGILALFVAEERHVKPDTGTAATECPLSALNSCCDFIWLSRNNVAQIIDVLALKTGEQTDRVRAILDRLRSRLPAFAPSAETFVELYPIHPLLFNALFQLRSLLPRFSPLNFIQTAIASSLDRPAERLVSLDSLFDWVMPELRQKYGPLLTRYDEFRARIIPQMKERVRHKAEALLKGIAFSTICGSLPSSVRALANSVLLYDESDLLPGYSLTFALLMEMEQRGDSYLLAQGENLERRYRLLHEVKCINAKGAREFLEREHEFRLQIPLLIYDWVRRNIQGWTPHSSPRYRRSSQTIEAPLPGSTQSVGLVHFKSLQDPLWSADDLRLMLEESHAWIVLILSPSDHFYELDPVLRKLAVQSGKILIWRPDAPSPAELERLRKSALDASGTAAPKKSGSSKAAKEQARRILTDLYVVRGKLITATDEWSIADDINGFSLTQYLANRLGKIASLDARDAARTAVRQRPVLDPTEAARWASAVAGDDLSGADADCAAERVLSWWAAIQKIRLSLTGWHALPESFRTVRLWSEWQSLLGHIDVLKPVMLGLRRRETSFVPAMTQVADHFRDLDRMVAWKVSLEKIGAMIEWAPEFERIREYVSLAFPTGQKQLDDRRAALLDLMDHPRRLAEGAAQKTFARMFEEFKSAYIDLYYSRHEDTLHISGNTLKNEPKVNSTALRNLEMLSNLHYMDKRYLNRVQVIGKWVHRSQCDLPVREILDTYPRCYCNFNPGANTQMGTLVARINGATQDGIEYFRNILRNCIGTIIEEIRNRKVDDHHARQIAALLSRGPMMPLKPRVIDILNEVIQKHAGEFLVHIRPPNGAGPE